VRERTEPLALLWKHVATMAERMGIRELRDTLAATIRRVRAGATIEVTHHGQPVATLSPARRDRIERLLAAGEVDRLLTSCLVVAVSGQLLSAARKLASPSVRTLDAIHLASVLRVDADELLAYDRRLLAAAGDRGLSVASPS